MIKSVVQNFLDAVIVNGKITSRTNDKLIESSILKCKELLYMDLDESNKSIIQDVLLHVENYMNDQGTMADYIDACKRALSNLK